MKNIGPTNKQGQSQKKEKPYQPGGRPARQAHILVAAAGSGRRFGSGDTPKQYRKLDGKAVLRHTLEKLLSFSQVGQIRVIIDPAHAGLYHDAVKGLDIGGPVHGSETRKESIYNGIKSFSYLENEDLILVHDAARPFVKSEDIGRLTEALNDNRAASLALPVSDTLRRDQKTVERDGLWAMQTPQGFEYGVIKQAHEKFKDDDHFTDDAGMVSAMGVDVAIVQGRRENFKITDPEDFALAEKLLAPGLLIPKTGFGYDVHAFDVDDSGPVRLCGVDLPYSKGLKGHSDADVGLHAITDALLGTIADGDIGSHFPPSDPQWRGVDSAAFLKHAGHLLRAQRGRIEHIDLTLICEAPKITAHRDDMRSSIAKILGLDIRHVSLKATTTEGLGFTGRGEGIAAQAVATVCFPHDA